MPATVVWLCVRLMLHSSVGTHRCSRATVGDLSRVCSAVIEEQGVRLKLTVTDTPGFGDQINNDQWYVAYISHS